MPGTPVASPLHCESFESALPLGIQEHVARRLPRRLLAVVDGDRLAGLRDVDEHEAAAAEIAGLRQRHREREADRDRRIDGVAAALQDIDADIGRERLLARHHPVRGVDRMHPVHVRVDRLCILR